MVGLLAIEADPLKAGHFEWTFSVDYFSRNQRTKGSFYHEERKIELSEVPVKFAKTLSPKTGRKRWR